MKAKSIQAIVQIPLDSIQTEKGAGATGVNPCLICGKEIKPTSRQMAVQLLSNGNIVSTSEDVEGSQGFYPVGLECAKKLVINFAFPA